MKFMMTLLIIVVSLFVGYYFGYQAGHIMVATECERLGKFFVGKKVYECVLITEIDKKEE